MQTHEQGEENAVVTITCDACGKVAQCPVVEDGNVVFTGSPPDALSIGCTGGELHIAGQKRSGALFAWYTAALCGDCAYRVVEMLRQWREESTRRDLDTLITGVAEGVLRQWAKGGEAWGEERKGGGDV